MIRLRRLIQIFADGQNLLQVIKENTICINHISDIYVLLYLLQLGPIECWQRAGGGEMGTQWLGRIAFSIGGYPPPLWLNHPVPDMDRRGPIPVPLTGVR